MVACVVLMSVTFLFVTYALFGYPLLLFLISKIKKPNSISKDSSIEPTVTYMIVAHNEEKCICKKLENILEFDYPFNKIQVLVASDFCTDSTNDLVEEFATKHPELNIVLNKSVEHKGKTNAQNEARKRATGEILIMTDANSIFKSNAIRELVSCFTSSDIAYVCGKLVYTNDYTLTGDSESTYWNFDLLQREIESNIQTITAGNGSIYAVRNEEYIDLNPIDCHDGVFPYKFALLKKRCLYNPNAISYEKAGENNKDEFKRKVRMNRTILSVFVNLWRPLNVFKYKWFSFFYFGHRTCRYLLWFNHLVFFIASIVLLCLGYYVAGGIVVGLQVIFFAVGILSIRHTFRLKPLKILGYYSMTVLAQLCGAFKQLIGKSKPTWHKAESTR